MNKQTRRRKKYLLWASSKWKKSLIFYLCLCRAASWKTQLWRKKILGFYSTRASYFNSFLQKLKLIFLLRLNESIQKISTIFFSFKYFTKDLDVTSRVLRHDNSVDADLIFYWILFSFFFTVVVINFLLKGLFMSAVHAWCIASSRASRIPWWEL